MRVMSHAGRRPRHSAPAVRMLRRLAHRAEERRRREEQRSWRSRARRDFQQRGLEHNSRTTASPCLGTLMAAARNQPVRIPVICSSAANRHRLHTLHLAEGKPMMLARRAGAQRPCMHTMRCTRCLSRYGVHAYMHMSERIMPPLLPRVGLTRQARMTPSRARAAPLASHLFSRGLGLLRLHCTSWAMRGAEPLCLRGRRLREESLRRVDQWPASMPAPALACGWCAVPVPGTVRVCVRPPPHAQPAHTFCRMCAASAELTELFCRTNAHRLGRMYARSICASVLPSAPPWRSENHAVFPPPIQACALQPYPRTTTGARTAMFSRWGGGRHRRAAWPTGRQTRACAVCLPEPYLFAARWSLGQSNARTRPPGTTPGTNEARKRARRGGTTAPTSNGQHCCVALQMQYDAPYRENRKGTPCTSTHPTHLGQLRPEPEGGCLLSARSGSGSGSGSRGGSIFPTPRGDNPHPPVQLVPPPSRCSVCPSLHCWSGAWDESSPLSASTRPLPDIKNDN